MNSLELVANVIRVLNQLQIPQMMVGPPEKGGPVILPTLSNQRRARASA